ncbi:hypothetical protein SLS62_007497 [Diatrype stigma]|uniref:GCS light chain n=1 Tax=Diatrype stigma TaxID=117547 RepID=A0AAN9UMJ3_9PEZI
MTRIILSTGNIISGGPSSIIRKPGTSRSNLELTNSLRNNFIAAQEDYGADAAAAAAPDTPAASTIQENGDISSEINGNGKRTHSPHPSQHPHAQNGDRPNGKKIAAAAAATTATDIWTAREGSVLYVPRIDWSSAGLQEERPQYEITVKLFYLPTGSRSESVSAVVADRARYTSEALGLVKKELGDIGDIDLLIVSFPGISFEGDCEWEADRRNAAMGSDAEERATWAEVLAPLHQRGEVGRLGLAEFGSEKLRRFLHDDSKDKQAIQVRPAVDQINVKNCCSVPPPLTQLAKEEGIELFTHNDCTDILPSGTLRELLGPGAQGAGVLAADDDEGRGGGLRGDLIPQWVVKYTAVVKDRGVIENKGYFAGAELIEA